MRLVDADAALSGEPGSFADYEHFTNAGSAKMARLLADAILAPGPAPSPASPPAPAAATAAP